VNTGLEAASVQHTVIGGAVVGRRGFGCWGFGRRGFGHVVIAWAAFAWVAATGCSDGPLERATDPNENPAGETHFLRLCSESCGGGLACLEGVCTRGCSQSADCDDLPGDPICSGEDSPTCSVACQDNADCSGISSSAICENGQCQQTTVSDPLADVPASCADELGDLDGQVLCTPEERCKQLQDDPGRKISYVLTLRDSDGPRLQERHACVRAFFESRGAREFRTRDDFLDVWMVGTPAQMQPALSLAGLSSIEVGCDAEDTCLECADKNESGCTGDAFCTSLGGRRLDADERCLETPSFLGCTHVGISCDDAITWSRSPQGQCFRLTNGCLPEAWEDPQSCNPDQPIDPQQSCRAASARCEDRDEASCVDSCAPIFATRYRGGISTGRVYAGCHDADTSCDDAIGCARSPDPNEADTCFEFTDLCFPEGWQSFNCGGGCQM